MNYREQLWQIIANVRDGAPRRPDDASTDDIVEALMPLIGQVADQRAADVVEQAALEIDAKSSLAYDEDDEAYEDAADFLRMLAAALRPTMADR